MLCKNLAFCNVQSLQPQIQAFVLDYYVYYMSYVYFWETKVTISTKEKNANYPSWLGD